MIRYLEIAFAFWFIPACVAGPSETWCAKIKNSNELSGTGFMVIGFPTGPHGGGLCYQFADEVSPSKKILYYRSIEVGMTLSSCVDKSYKGGPVRPLQQTKNVEFGFETYYRRYYLEFRDWLGPKDCIECKIKSPQPVTTMLEGSLIDFGDLFSVYMYTSGIVKAYNADINAPKLFDAIVTMESATSPIRKILMDDKRCAANTSTDPADWVEIDEHDNIVPIFSSAVT